jgi:hypothetical protein
MEVESVACFKLYPRYLRGLFLEEDGSTLQDGVCRVSSCSPIPTLLWLISHEQSLQYQASASSGPTYSCSS